MEKKKYVVSFHFNVDIEAETDSEAMVLGAGRIPFGFASTKKLSMSIIACIPIAETPAPVAAPKRFADIETQGE